MSDSTIDTSCKICQNPFTTPKLVNCLHTFCEMCIIASRTVDSPEIFTCPVCMHETILVDGSTKSLATNSYITSFQSLNDGLSAGFCVVCLLGDKEVNTSHICLSCKDNLCETCAKGHNSSTLTASHRVVPIDELNGQVTLKKTEINCHKHPRLTAKVFCHTCCKPICVDCALFDHKTHPTATLESAVEVKLKSLSKKIQTVSKKPVITDAVETAKTELEQLDSDESEFFQVLKENTQWFIEKIEKDSQDVMEKGRKAFVEERKLREKRLEQATYQVPRRDNVLEVCSTFLTSGGLEVLETVQTLQNGLKLVTEQNQHGNRTLMSFKVQFNVPKDQNMISFKEEILSLKRENEDAKSLKDDENDGITKAKRKRKQSKKSKLTGEEEAVSHDTNDPLSAVGQDTSTGNVTAGNGNTQTTMKKKTKGPQNDIVPLVFKRSFTVKVSTDKAEPEVSCLNFRSPDTCMLMDTANRKLKVMKLSGELVYLVNVGDKCPPFEKFIHFPSGDLMFAVFENKLLALTRHLKTVSEIPLVEEKSYTKSPVVANYGENILVGNLPNNEMRVLNEKGALVRSWTSKFDKNLHQESITYVTEDKVAMTSSSGTGHVMLESETTGELLSIAFGLNDVPKAQPSQAVVDSKGHVIICDPLQHTVSVFTCKGLPHICHNTKDQGMEEPKCLLLAANDDLYVSCKSGKIVVYEVPAENV